MQIRIITANACLSVCPPLRFNGAFARSDRFVNALYQHVSNPSDVDIICLQELIINRAAILKQFHTWHPFATSIVHPRWIGKNIRFVQSGLTIVSKWPIVDQDAHIFSGPSYHAECFMAKSVLYAKIQKEKKYFVHVFVTHTQAWSNEKAKEIRKQQFKQIFQFITSKSIPQEEPIFLTGDFNIDFYEHSRMIQEIMSDIKMTLHLPTHPAFSFDPTMNQLVGTDDANEYITRSQTNGCYEEFIQTGMCSCCPRQLIDGICTSSIHLKPISSNVEVVQNVADIPFEMYINVSTTRKLTNVSDHFAILGKFVFPDKIPQSSFTPPKINMLYMDEDWIWILVQVLLTFGFCFLFLRFGK